MKDRNHEEIKSVRWSGMTDVGRFRKNNEDSFLAMQFNAQELWYLGKYGDGALADGDFLFAVSDGMGGAKSGEFASKLAVEQLMRLLPKNYGKADEGFADILLEVFERTNLSLMEMGKHYEECAGMGATLSMCWLTPHWMNFCHVGDSRIYFLPKEGAMKQITEDHSYVGKLYREGKINEREARTHPQRNVIEQCLGGRKKTIAPQVGRVACSAGDRFLLCSDGLSDGLWNHAIEDLCRTVEPNNFKVDALIRESVSESGKDNTTALLFEVNQ